MQRASNRAQIRCSLGGSLLNYDTISGRSLERLSALSDGVFSIAMTLLVLDLKVPAAEALHTNRDLLHALGSLAPRLLTYGMSFLTLGIFWLGQQAQLGQFRQSDRRLTWIHIAFLLMVAVMPFSTALLSEFIVLPLAVMCYWLNLFLLGCALFASIRYAVAAGLLEQGADAPPVSIHERRILIFQGLYLLAALVSWANTYVSIFALILLQLVSIFMATGKRA